MSVRAVNIVSWSCRRCGVPLGCKELGAETSREMHHVLPEDVVALLSKFMARQSGTGDSMLRCQYLTEIISQMLHAQAEYTVRWAKLLIFSIKLAMPHRTKSIVQRSYGIHLIATLIRLLCGAIESNRWSASRIKPLCSMAQVWCDGHDKTNQQWSLWLTTLMNNTLWRNIYRVEQIANR